jgi:hypothetical protein
MKTTTSHINPVVIRDSGLIGINFTVCDWYVFQEDGIATPHWFDPAAREFAFEAIDHTAKKYCMPPEVVNRCKFLFDEAARQIAFDNRRGFRIAEDHVGKAVNGLWIAFGLAALAGVIAWKMSEVMQ